MNPFFDISEEEELPFDALALTNLGKQRPWITRGRRGSDFWGTDGIPSKTTYRDTTAEDYDQQFVRKLSHWKPIYRIDKVIEHHYDHYLAANDHVAEDFIMHMRYIILPLLKKKKNIEVCVERFEQWLHYKELQKQNTSDFLTTKPHRTVHRIHFDDLSWSDFERLIFAYTKRLRKWDMIDWLGQAGHDQGQDIWGESNGESYCYLCANYRSLTLRKAKEDIDKLISADRLPDHLVVVCGGKVSASVNKSIKSYALESGVADVEIWSGVDIEEDLRIKTPELLSRFFEGDAFPESKRSPLMDKREPMQQQGTTEPYRKVFISYAKEDYKYAVELYDYLNHHGYRAWLDKKNLLAGSNWDSEIKKALKESDFIILLLSSISVSKRGYVQREYKLALQFWEERVEDDIYIIPVLINECEVPANLNRFHWLQYDEDAFASIVRSLNVQRTKLAGQPIGQQKSVENKPETFEETKNEQPPSKEQLALSKKVHDVVANGIYRILKELQASDKTDQALLDRLEQMYEQSREISYEVLRSGYNQAIDLKRQIAEVATDFAIVCALKVELDAFLKAFPELKPETSGPVNRHRYYTGRIMNNDGGSYRIVLTFINDYGNMRSASASAELINRWKPRYIIVSGVAGGIGAKVNIGDVIVSKEVIYYEGDGSKQLRSFTPDLQLLDAFRRNLEVIRYSLGESTKHLDEANSLDMNIFIGDMASGEKVINSLDNLRHLGQLVSRNLIGVEMETAGIASTSLASTNHVGFLTIRAICDLVDHHKSDDYRELAANTAALCVKIFLSTKPVAYSDGDFPVTDQAPKRENISDQRRRIFERLQNSVDLEEFKNFCFLLGIDVDELPGDRKSSRIRELILLFERQGELPILELALSQI